MFSDNHGTDRANKEVITIHFQGNIAKEIKMGKTEYFGCVK